MMMMMMMHDYKDLRGAEVLTELRTGENGWWHAPAVLGSQSMQMI